MDSLIRYREILRAFLLDYAGVPALNGQHITDSLVIDEGRDHYLLIATGWHQDERVYSVIFHFDIVDGKVWIQQNNTNRNPAEELAYLGIPRADIVEDVFPPAEQEMIERAVA